KEKRADELFIANKELLFQNEEKEKRAAELIIANKELVFQNEEKVKRAAELIIANKELVFQNREKEKRADESIIANKELVFQNEEKEKRAEELMNAQYKSEASDRNLKEAHKIAGLGTFEFDILTGICRTSPILNEMFGIDENYDPTFSGRAALLHPDDREMVLNELMNNVNSNIQQSDIEFRIVRDNDKITRWIHGFGKLEFDADGHPIKLHGTAQDITERKQSEAEILELNRDLELRVKQRTSELEATNKELEAFSYSVSHDLKAPLRHISSFIGLFLEKIPKELTKEQLGYLDVISSSASDMGKLIDGILNFSRLNAIELKKQTICSSDLVQQVIQFFEPDVQNRIITFKVAPLPDINGDEGLFRQVWINLISNAIKYSMKKPEAIIEIGSFSGDNEDTFFVKDNGAGFNMKYAEKLFGVFKRLHKTSDFEGVGIGLANVNRIITRHGGRCRAEGEVNKGATFYFTLPNKTNPEEKTGIQ
ncbi:MAG: ATP-binding protein, partial [Bacteroidota bacterium]